MPLLNFSGTLKSFCWRNCRHQFFSIFAAGLIALLPIILFVHRYIDDYRRSFSGLLGWDDVGRPLANFIFYLANFGRPSIAVAPLYVLLSIFLYACMGLLIVKAFGLRSSLWSALAVLPLFAQPYGLENLSYGFDSVFMSLSASLAIVAAILLQASFCSWTLFGAFFLLLFASCMYQPGVSGFIPSAGFLIIGGELRLLVGRLAVMSLRVRLLRSVVAYGAAMVAYRVLALLTYDQWNGYGEKLSQVLDAPKIFSFWFAGRLVEVWVQIAADFGQGLPLLALICLVVSYGLMVCRRAGLRRGFALLGVAVLVALASPGPLLLLKESMLGVPRMLLFLGPLLMFICVQLMALVRVESLQKVRGSYSLLCHAFVKSSLFIFAWLLLVFSYAYGHSFQAQNMFEQQRISRLIGGVSELQVVSPVDEFRYALVEGVMPASPLLSNTVRKFPLIDRLVPRLLQNDWSHGLRQLAFYGLRLDRVKQGNINLSSLPDCASVQSLCRSEFQLFRVNHETILIKLLPIKNPPRQK
ncbi:MULTISPECIES: glucosyltransferase domain-containing protein [unclassified Prochlorococcus]|uniref:glucosyltransferase domain-containing protein n=1 Tax=unclassified Prochlorococcus TaxID=2627481 RepID=UPI0039A47488